MCGISGFIDFNKGSNERVLTKMSDTLTHRGPDGSGTFFFETEGFQCGLAHRRLSIIDLSERGKQPMQFDKYSITFNGEIYNFHEVRAELVKLGHSFTSNTDTEVILHAYSQWGINCMSRFIGMFAFAIYDNEKKELTLVRDRPGVKPLYYYYHKGLFLFASELKAFHQHPDFQKKLNVNSVAAFMQFGNVPAPDCIFENCYKLKPGHYLRVTAKTGTVMTACYWNVYANAYNQPKLNLSFEDAKHETEDLLASAFKYRMVSDVPVGVFLSGGYDSVCVASLLQKETNDKIKTFTIGVPDMGLDESRYAREIAKHLGTDHHEFFCTEEEAVEIVGQLAFFYDEPFADSSAIPTTLVSQKARQHVTVALSGDGGDEIFAGYNRYDYMMKHGRLLARIPAAARNPVASIMKKVSSEKIPVLKHKYNFHHRYNKLRMLLKDPSARNMMMSLSVQYVPDELAYLFNNDVSLADNAYNSTALDPDYYSPLAYMMAVDYETYLPDDILQKVDRASMSTSLEAREPFLDHRIIEFCAKLPDIYKYNKGVKKHLLREIVHKYVPLQMMSRPKMGFAVPIEKWLRGQLKETALFHLQDSEIKNQGIFNEAAVRDMKQKFFVHGKTEYATKIWYMLMFQMWFRRWMT